MRPFFQSISLQNFLSFGPEQTRLGFHVIDQLSFHEKLILMEALWDAISQQEDQLDVPPWHKDILDERERLLREGKAKFIDWEVAKQEIAENICIAASENFAVETTLSGKANGKLIRRVKERNYRVILHFLWLPDVELAIQRVKKGCPKVATPSRKK